MKLICVGKTVQSYLKEGEDEYITRLKHYCEIEKVEIPELKNAKKLSFNEIKKQEGSLILGKIGSSDTVILLDEKGKTFDSIEYSKFIQKKLNSGVKNIVFVIGGAYGFSDEVYARMNDKIALSKMTFSHQMIRLFFLEQLYRAHTILKNQPYHHQ